MRSTFGVFEAYLSPAFVQWPERGRLTFTGNTYVGFTAWQRARATRLCIHPLSSSGRWPSLLSTVAKCCLVPTAA
eukprot:1357688-Lingulodinium_polyedra.AAC.1